MSVLFLCVADKLHNNAAVLQVEAGELRVVYVTDTVSKKVDSILEELAKDGVSVRAEHFTPGQINVDREKVEAEDPRYLAGCAEEFSARGFKTFIYPAEKAEIFRKFFELAVPVDLRATFIHRLNLLNKNATEELQDILDQAVARATGK